MAFTKLPFAEARNSVERHMECPCGKKFFWHLDHDDEGRYWLALDEWMRDHIDHITKTRS